MATLTDKLSPVVEAIYDLSLTNREVLGLEDVWFGDQELIPRFPALAIEPGVLTKSLYGGGLNGKTENKFTVYGILYLQRVSDVQETKKEVTKQAEDIMDLWTSDSTLGGLLTFSFVSAIEPGYSMRKQSLLRAARIVWEGTNVTPITRR